MSFHLKDYMPVILVHGAIMIFDKILATRLADELPFLVGNHQSAFVRGRALHDNFMLVQCTARGLHALKNPTMLLKLDISKAIDTVKWPFLLEVMTRLGFGRRWIEWVCGLLATSTMKIAVNGVPGETIYNACGLRQGDPISPMLFILCMEPLQALFKKATQQGIFAPLARSGVHQRLSMFADDVMVFFKPTVEEIQACREILALFWLLRASW